MALSSFQERLEQLDQTRIQRLSLLQAEKELQSSKSQVLASKIANIRSVERRCLLLEQKLASQNLKISFLKSKIESSDEESQINLQRLRVLKEEIGDLEKMKKEREEFYRVKRVEMEEFRRNVEIFVVESRMQVEELRHHLQELQSSFAELQTNSGYSSNSEIAAAEMKRSELIAWKESLGRDIASNYRIRAQLQKQLKCMLIDQNQEHTRLSRLAQNKDSKSAIN